ncbi:hypothetical protein Btru_073372 [Bulinus truncatus]|nr:hypothetical protein Btru_073372 [Bulinus truncatus]
MADHEEDQEFSESANLNKKKYHDGVNYHDDDAPDDIGEKSPLNSGAYYDQNVASSSCNEPLIGVGGYAWPQVSVQSPYLSMAMMVYKDPALTYGPFISAPLLPSETCTAGPVVVVSGSDMAVSRGEQHPLTAGGKPLPAQLSIDTAILETTSTTLHQSQAAASASGYSQIDAAVLPASGQQDCVRIFPSDYLNQYHQRSGVNPSSASAGISSLPNSTAFMMIRTLELQETI